MERFQALLSLVCQASYESNIQQPSESRKDFIDYLIELGDGRISAFSWDDFIEYFIENNSSLNLENNSSIDRYIVKTVNIMGQNVNNNFDGVILYMYNNGSIERKYFIK